MPWYAGIPVLALRLLVHPFLSVLPFPFAQPHLWEHRFYLEESVGYLGQEEDIRHYNGKEYNKGLVEMTDFQSHP